MRTPLSWLQDFAPFGDDVDRLAEGIVGLGFEVREVTQVGEGLGEVVVARVLEVGPIPGLDRVRRVLVDAGSDVPVEVACGASNFAVGDRVALAPVGCVLPGDFTITERKFRGGFVSHGMLCSRRELGLGTDHRGILVLDPGSGSGSAAGPGPARPGTPLLDVIEVEPDAVIEITDDASRPEAGSVAGLARLLAARLALPFEAPGGGPLDTSGPPAGVTLTLDAAVPCSRFTAWLLRGVEVVPSPERVARRLELAGTTPVNNVVDAANYVLLELGQPMQPYDAASIAGPGFRVRAARPGEAVVTSDGVRRTLGADVGADPDGHHQPDCVVCDAEDTVVGIGGVIDAAGPQVGTSTSAVLLEAACFDAEAVARTAARLDLHTASSARFSAGCDASGIEPAVTRFVEVLRLSGGPSMTIAPGPADSGSRSA